MLTKALTNWFFYALLGLFIVFLYGPMFGIILLSFQGPSGGLTFPMNGVSLHWIGDLFKQQRVGAFQGSFLRSLSLGLLVSVLTTAFSYAAGLAFRRGFPGATFLFYLTVTSLIVPSILVSLGIGLTFSRLGLETHWMTSALGAHLTWTLPFGLLIMFAIFNRLPQLRRSRPRPGRIVCASSADGGDPDDRTEPDRYCLVWFHAEL